MKKIIGVIACGLFLNAAAASSQVTDKEKVQMEKRIEKLIKKMTLEEKVGLLHGNSKFYVAGVERLGIPEWSLSDGPHGVRAEINRHDWAYAGWTNDSASYFPTGTAFAAAWNPELAYRRGEVLGEEGVKNVSAYVRHDLAGLPLPKGAAFNLEAGKQAYATTCVACHQAEGQGLPPMFPALKGSKIATGPKQGHLDIVFHGKPGTAMGAFGKQLSEVDIAAVITYERNAWGNAMNDMVTPQEVLALKQAEEK